MQYPLGSVVPEHYTEFHGRRLFVGGFEEEYLSIPKVFSWPVASTLESLENLYATAPKGAFRSFPLHEIEAAFIILEWKAETGKLGSCPICVSVGPFTE